MEESNKSHLRNAALKRRTSADPVFCRNWSQIIQARVLGHPAYRDAESVAAYRAVGNEVETRTVIGDALLQGKRVFVPAPGADYLFVKIFSEEDELDACAAGREVVSAVWMAQQSKGGLMVLVPAVSWDLLGHRLGRGGGWYDRVLQALDGRGVYAGLGYEFQIVPRVPTQSWDQRVHFVFTESRVIDCGMQTSVQTVR